MSQHLPILPILLPLAVALTLLIGRLRLRTRRGVAVVAVAVQLVVAVWLVAGSGQGLVMTYALGDWAAPFGIVLVVDRLAALMVAITAVLSACCLLHSISLDRDRGLHFHPLFQFQVMGIQGAFLTGDLFNLFVFFELLLIASYALVTQGGTRPRLAAGFHYIVINLTGSSLFLIAVALIYNELGTLNMAHIADLIRTQQPGEFTLVPVAVALLFLVFAIKAAVFPLGFWLPRAYAAAAAPVAGLFAVMTKVGVYALLRLYYLWLADLSLPWVARVTDALVVAGGLTLGIATLGVLGSTRLRQLNSWLIVAGAGTLVMALGAGSAAPLSAVLYYMVHSTWLGAVGFLLADGLDWAGSSDRFDTEPSQPQPPHPLSLVFMVFAVAVAGLPPLSGFFGKLLLLQGTAQWVHQGWYWALVLASSLVVAVALARAGSRMFWTTAAPVQAPAPGWRLVPLGALVGASVLWVMGADPVVQFLEATGMQIRDPDSMVGALVPPVLEGS